MCVCGLLEVLYMQMSYQAQIRLAQNLVNPIVGSIITVFDHCGPHLV